MELPPKIINGVRILNEDVFKEKDVLLSINFLKRYDLLSGIIAIGFEGYTKRKSIKLKLFTKGNMDKVRRIAYLKNVSKRVNGVYKRDAGKSTVGNVSCNGFLLRQLNECYIDNDHHGRENELAFKELIEKAIELYGYIVLNITDYFSGKFITGKVVGVKDTSTDYSDGKRGDISLICDDGTILPISVKQPNFHFVCGDEKFLNNFVNKIGKYLYFDDTMKEYFLQRIGKNVREIVYDISEEEKNYSFFGSDIVKDKGCVVVCDFRGMKLSKIYNEDTHELSIKCMCILRSYDDLSKKEYENYTNVKGIVHTHSNRRKSGYLKNLRSEIAVPSRWHGSDEKYNRSYKISLEERGF